MEILGKSILVIISLPMVVSSSICRRRKPQTLCCAWSNNYDSRKWSCPVEVVTAKLRSSIFLAELRDREQAREETLIRMSEEVEEIRKAFCFETQLRDEAYMDAMSLDDGNNLEI